ncbi:protein QNR-71 isoform X1 [Anguilla rostrata]|uniref:protein QNR-71 isoform X1 n=1 Tax=Anguilla rostrata TaxID=7938 RepID=UPI0030CC552F
MGGWQAISYLALAFLISHADGLKTYRDMFAHAHSVKFPPIPGWFPDSNPWDDYLYPPFRPQDLLLRGKGKHVSVHLSSDGPAIQGSCITFTAALEYPKCQREDANGDANGDAVYDEHCDDGTEASANGQVRTVYSWTSWLDDYGFGKCLDPSLCNVFPDGRPFPQSNDWRRKSYVYVWHTMGQYFETYSGSSSSLTLNTSKVELGAGMMEVMVYRMRDRRKYSPTASDNGVYFVTDKIPLAVNLSQKQAQNLSENLFVRGADLVFNVLLHDPSSYLKTAAAVDYIWDFSDGNQLVTHSNVATHAYSDLGNVTVKLIVQAAFPVPCPPSKPTANPTAPPETHTATGKVGPTRAATTVTFPRTTAAVPVTTAGVPMTTADMTTVLPTTEPLPPTTDAVKTPGFSGTPTAGADPTHPESTAPPLWHQRPLQETECYRYLYGNFQKEILIVEGKLAVQSVQANKITDVSAAKVTNTTVSFLVKCLGSTPTSACTIISDAPCREVQNIVCDDVPPAPACEVTLKRTFLHPGTYCVNITLEGVASLALASTHVTIEPGEKVSEAPQAAAVVLSTSAVLVAIFGFIAFTVYKRYKVYRPVRRSPAETEEGGVWLRFGRLRSSRFPANEERSRLLHNRPPL